MAGAAGWCGRLQASLWYNDFIALGHVVVDGTSGSHGSCIFKVVSALFSIILLVFLQSVMNKRVHLSARTFSIYRGFDNSYSYWDESCYGFGKHNIIY